MIKILWADDEIDLLNSHVLYLESKGYSVTPVNSGDNALDLLVEKNFDIIFLDENMPGISGLETLTIIKEKYPSTPVIMITKSEEERIMEEAIGSKIADYLIKPVNPNQILLAIKKNIDKNRLIGERTSRDYQQEFRNISTLIGSANTVEEWYSVYKKIIYWELELDKSKDSNMDEILALQKSEANLQFFKFVKKNYKTWISSEAKPLMSHNLFLNKINPFLNSNKNVYLIVIDNLRFDQWKIIEPLVLEDFNLINEDMYMSILPTSTQYSRNSIFSGLHPGDIQKKFPSKWVDEENSKGKNDFESDFLHENLKRLGKENIKYTYNKITNFEAGNKMINRVSDLKNNLLNVIVYNFVDILSHAKTEMKVIKELVKDDSAYRSLTYSWFSHSPLREIMKKIALQGAKLVITTDHGTINVNKPSKLIGERDITSNLRFKNGRNMKYIKEDVFEINNPSEYNLPSRNLSGKYIFAKENTYFVYQNNFNYYAKFYKNSYQHGGVSLEEMLVPCLTLSSK